MLKPPDPVLEPVERIQKNLLARPERKLLNWLCSVLPAWITPDILTSLGVAGAVMTFAGYAASGFECAAKVEFFA